MMCHEADQSAFLYTHLYSYLRILIISYLATFLSTNSLSVLMCHKAVNQSINHEYSESWIIQRTEQTEQTEQDRPTAFNIYITFTSSLVLHAIKRLKIKTKGLPDGIPRIFLKMRSSVKQLSRTIVYMQCWFKLPSTRMA